MWQCSVCELWSEQVLEDLSDAQNFGDLHDVQDVNHLQLQQAWQPCHTCIVKAGTKY
jgi:hypothetical protein